ncbi:MAG TPA: DinB family protein [Chloroflexota bacterium]|jgi:hypothetical protein|nr:DinB family protein [Chloroflexota bacterium]
MWSTLQIGWGLKDGHDRFRAVVQGLSGEQLNADLGPETNSVAVLVIHALGAERQVLTMVGELPEPRDRDAEFRTRVDDPAPLLEALDRADRLVDEIVPRLTEQQLEQPFVRNDLTLSGARWLIRAFGHVREHAAHAELTKQVLLMGRR